MVPQKQGSEVANFRQSSGVVPRYRERPGRRRMEDRREVDAADDPAPSSSATRSRRGCSRPDRPSSGGGADLRGERFRSAEGQPRSRSSVGVELASSSTTQRSPASGARPTRPRPDAVDLRHRDHERHPDPGDGVAAGEPQPAVGLRYRAGVVVRRVLAAPDRPQRDHCVVDRSDLPRDMVVQRVEPTSR